MDYDLGVAQLSQQEKSPDIAAGQLAGTTTYNLKNLAGQQAQRVQGVGFGGASGARVGQNWVGASDDELEKVANPEKAAAEIEKTAAPAEDMHRLRKLSGINDKEIEEAPEVSTTPAPKPANPPPMPPAGQAMDLSKVDNDTLFNKHQQLQSTLATMAPKATDKAAPASGPGSDDMTKGVMDQLNQAQEELKKRGYTDQQLKSNVAPAAAPKSTAPAQTESKFKEELDAMLTIARLR